MPLNIIEKRKTEPQTPAQHKSLVPLRVTKISDRLPHSLQEAAEKQIQPGDIIMTVKNYRGLPDEDRLGPKRGLFLLHGTYTHSNGIIPISGLVYDAEKGWDNLTTPYAGLTIHEDRIEFRSHKVRENQRAMQG